MAPCEWCGVFTFDTNMAISSPNKSPLFPEPGIEVVDNAGEALLIMPRDQVLRQKLRHRTVLVCLRNTGGGIFLYKKHSASSGATLSVSSDPGPVDDSGDHWLPAIHGRVLAGEARYDAGERLLGQVFGIAGLELFETARFSGAQSGLAGNVETTLFLTAKTSAIPWMRNNEVQEGLFVDQEEFRAILRDYPHMLTPLWNLALPYFFSP